MRRGRRGGSRSLLVLLFVRCVAKKCVHDAFVRASKERERWVVSARISSAKKRRRGRFTPAFCSENLWCQEIRMTIRLCKEGETHRQRLSSRRRQSALRASLRSARAIILLLLVFLLLSFFSAGCCCCWSLKASSFFLSKSLVQVVRCVVVVVVVRRRRRFRHQNSALLPSFFCFSCFCVRFGETTFSPMVVLSKKKTTKKDSRLSLVSVVVGLSISREKHN